MSSYSWATELNLAAHTRRTRAAHAPHTRRTRAALTPRLLTTPLLEESTPSMHASIWLRVCSTSSFEPVRRKERCLPSASSSSTKMRHGEDSAASLNSARIRAAPRPTNSSTKSEPEQ